MADRKLARGMRGVIQYIERSLYHAEKVETELATLVEYGEFNSETDSQRDDLRVRKSSLEGDLRNALDVLYEELVVLLEMTNLPQTSLRFRRRWRKLLAEDQVPVSAQPTTDDLFFFSPALSHLRWTFHLIRARYIRAPKSPKPLTDRLALLLQILRATPVLLREHGKTPKCEREIQQVMHPILRTVFNQLTSVSKGRTVLPKGIKSYEPDCAIPNLGVAVEFKFCDSEREAPVRFDELCADLHGYAGSKDYPTLVAVFYQTEAFLTEERLATALLGAERRRNWHVVLVTGGGGRAASPITKRSR